MAGMVLPLLELTYQYRTFHGQYFWGCAPAYKLQSSISNPQTNASIAMAMAPVLYPDCRRDRKPSRPPGSARPHR